MFEDLVEKFIMHNIYLLIVLSFFSILPAKAGIKTTCPDLIAGDSTSDWIVWGNITSASFKRALISQARVLGENTVTCKYDENLNLVKVGNFQIATNDGLWQSVNLGGLWFKQCLATTKHCSFYSA